MRRNSTFAILILLLATSLAAAVTSWMPETLLQQNFTSVWWVRTAVNDSGTAVAVWDQQDGAGTTQVFASVYTPGAPGTWSSARPLGAQGMGVGNKAAIVTPSGLIFVFWMEGSAYYLATYNGSWSLPETIPAETGYTLPVGAGVDSAGNLQVAVAFQVTGGTYRTYNVEVLMRYPDGMWTTPVHVNTTPISYPRFVMNRSGQALVAGGLLIHRSPGFGVWGTPQAIDGIGGQIDSTDVAIDAGGNGYFVYRSRYGGANLSTSTLSTAWTRPRHLLKFDILGRSLAVAASSAGHAAIYGQDYNTYNAFVGSTTDGGRTWGGKNFGLAYSGPKVTASESGLYAVCWVDKTEAFRVAIGNGTNTGWTQSLMAYNYPDGPVAISGTQISAAWVRWIDSLYSYQVVGTRTGSVLP